MWVGSIPARHRYFFKIRQTIWEESGIASQIPLLDPSHSLPKWGRFAVRTGFARSLRFTLGKCRALVFRGMKMKSEVEMDSNRSEDFKKSKIADQTGGGQ